MVERTSREVIRVERGLYTPRGAILYKEWSGELGLTLSSIVTFIVDKKMFRFTLHRVHPGLLTSVQSKNNHLSRSLKTPSIDLNFNFEKQIL